MEEYILPIIGIVRLRMGSDGKGIRTLIGTYGCPLRCGYCLNPHSWDGSLPPYFCTPEELYEAVRIDNLYFRATDGGITMGGGEPLLHMDGIEAFAALCPEAWSLWAETALHVGRECVERAARVFDHFIVDIKTADAEIYKNYTGRELQTALDNLLYLRDRVGARRITVRVPLIPGYADEDSQRESIRRIREMGFEDIDALVYTTKGQE